MSRENHVIGVDLGGTHVFAGVLDKMGRVLLRKETDIDLSRTPGEIIGDYIIPTIKKAIDEDRAGGGEVRAIGMGVPGSHDSHRGICYFSPNFRWRNVNVTQPIQSALGLPVFMLNDARCHALGEKHFGAGIGILDFVCCAIGTGVGGGIVSGGKLILGDSEVAGEIGHITVDPYGYRCQCGNRGCLEALASGPNIARRGREAMEKDEGRTSFLWEMVDSPGSLTARHLFDGAERGDDISLKVWRDTGAYLGIGFASIIHTVNPERFIMGGQVSRALKYFLPSLKKEIAERATMIDPDSIDIVPAVLEENAGVVGAGALAFEKMEIL